MTKDEDFPRTLREIAVDQPVLIDTSHPGAVSSAEGIVKRETPEQFVVSVSFLPHELRFRRSTGLQLGGSYRIAVGEHLDELLIHRKKARLVSAMKQDWRADRDSVEAMRKVARQAETLLRALGEWNRPKASPKELPAPPESTKQRRKLAPVDRINHRSA